MVVNSSLVYRKTKENSHILRFPFTDIAVQLGNIKIANMVALGCYLSKRKVVDVGDVSNIIEEIAPAAKAGLVEINKKAVRAGYDLIK